MLPTCTADVVCVCNDKLKKYIILFYELIFIEVV